MSSAGCAPLPAPARCASSCSRVCESTTRTGRRHRASLQARDPSGAQETPSRPRCASSAKMPQVLTTGLGAPAGPAHQQPPAGQRGRGRCRPGRPGPSRQTPPGGGRASAGGALLAGQPRGRPAPGQVPTTAIRAFQRTVRPAVLSRSTSRIAGRRRTPDFLAVPHPLHGPTASARWAPARRHRRNRWSRSTPRCPPPSPHGPHRRGKLPRDGAPRIQSEA